MARESSYNRREVSPSVERLKLAMVRRDLEEISYLLKNKLFEMTDDEMDALMWQLLQWMDKRNEKLGIPLEQLLSHKALLLWAVQKNDEARLKAKMHVALRASSYAFVALEAAKCHAGIKIIRFLFNRSCQAQLWDAGSSNELDGTALPLLYEAWLLLREIYMQLNDLQSPIKLLCTTNASKKEIKTYFLHFGAKTNNIEVVKLLLTEFATKDNKFADSCCRGDKTHTTPLQRACYHGNMEVVQLLLNYDRVFLSSEDHRGWTALHFAAEQGWHEVVQEIIKCVLPIESSGHVNKQDISGLTPLHLAAACSSVHVFEGGPNYLEVINILVNAGADVNIKDFTSHQDIYLETYLATIRLNHDEISIQSECFWLNPVMSLFWSPGGFTALHYAIIYGRDSLVAQKIVGDKNCQSVKDEEHLTAFDWAQVVRHDQERTDDCNHRMDHADGLYLHIMELEKFKKEIDWFEKMGIALRSCKWDVAHTLVASAISSGIKVGYRAWEHLKWAGTEADYPIETEWTSTYPKEDPILRNIKQNDSRHCLQPPKHSWKLKVQWVMLGLLEGKVMCDKIVLQNCLLWAMRMRMYELA